MKKAWEIEKEIRVSAVPMDRRKHESSWFDPEVLIRSNDMLLKIFWNEKVPGSGAPEHAYVEMVQAQANKGFDVSAAEKLLPVGLQYSEREMITDLRALTGLLQEAIFNAPKIEDHPYHQFSHPKTWNEVRASFGKTDIPDRPIEIPYLAEKIYQGWLGQLAGASFGTAIEGYTGKNIEKIYGEVSDYITEPETMNDDVVYELIFLDVFEKFGRRIISREIALEWLKQIPFAWSAEWLALENLRMGIFPPDSGFHRNPYSNWIGAQMRGMVCGMLSPGRPLEAARLAQIDGVVSHAENGVYGEIFSAVLTSLAFLIDDERELIQIAAQFIPLKSEYRHHLDFVLTTIGDSDNAEQVLPVFEEYFQKYNWIHSYPNMAADVTALWYGGGDMTRTFSLLAKAGLDVDCNGGLVGNILGVMHGVPDKWAAPLGDLLETYLPGKEKLSIERLSVRTAELAGINK